MDTTLQSLLNGFPSFAGLIFCIIVLARLLEQSDKRNDRLQEALIKRENCEESEQ